jgi:hypothetical protein
LTEKIVPNLKMHPFNTTLMGVVKGVADYFGLDYSDAWLFGGSGHAFLINIHEELCPSGPYCWNPEAFYMLVRNLGIEMTDLGFFSVESTFEERKRIEETLRKSIDAKVPCSLLNMENQIISGYDDTHFIVQQPWPQNDFPLKTVTFQTWKELGEEVHVNFYTFTKKPIASEKKVVKDSLNFAVGLVQNPDKHTEKPYYTGLKAYDAWIQAVKDGYGSSHGNWWNGTVWWECRVMATKYFAEIASKYHREVSEQAAELNNQYRKVAQLLNKAKDKELADAKKIKVLQEAQKAEESCIKGIKELLRFY